MKVIISDDDDTVLEVVSVFVDPGIMSEAAAAADMVGLISLRYEVKEDD